MKHILSGMLLALPLLAASNDSFLLRNITIHPVSGPDIPNGTLLVQNGRIAEVSGGKVAAPKSVRVIDGKGLHAYPGMIDSATQVGLSEIGSVRETNDTNELGDFNPQLKALVAVNPESEHLPVTRANGITSVITMPALSGGGGMRGGGSNPVIAGQTALIHLDGWTWEDLAVSRAAAVELLFPTLETRRFRMETMSVARTPFAEVKTAYDKRLRQLNDFFETARRYQQARSAHRAGFQPDLKLEAMIPLLEGKMPVMVIALRERAIRDAIKFAGDQKIKIVLAGPREFGNTLAEVKAKGIPVIASPTLELPLEEDDPYDAAFTLPSELYKAGIKFAFGSFSVQFARNLPYQAAAAVAFGLPYAEALKAVTLNPAEIWGVADQIGSIEKGKWADLMLTDGDPLEARTHVKQMFIKGRQVDLASKHTRLYDKYMNRP